MEPNTSGKFEGVYGAQNRSVQIVHEDSSTGTTHKLSEEQRLHIVPKRKILGLGYACSLSFANATSDSVYSDQGQQTHVRQKRSLE
jgi:hypothetical protein